jgi:hypothetical protein
MHDETRRHLHTTRQFTADLHTAVVSKAKAAAVVVPTTLGITSPQWAILPEVATQAMVVVAALPHTTVAGADSPTPLSLRVPVLRLLRRCLTMELLPCSQLPSPLARRSTLRTQATTHNTNK